MRYLLSVLKWFKSNNAIHLTNWHLIFIHKCKISYHLNDLIFSQSSIMSLDIREASCRHEDLLNCLKKNRMFLRFVLMFFFVCFSFIFTACFISLRALSVIFYFTIEWASQVLHLTWWLHDIQAKLTIWMTCQNYGWQLLMKLTISHLTSSYWAYLFLWRRPTLSWLKGDCVLLLSPSSVTGPDLGQEVGPGQRPGSLRL